jgi:hypothetical protein
MKALIATAVGGLALGGLVTAQALRSPGVDTSRAVKTIDTRAAGLDATTSPVLVNCGLGQRAVLRPTAMANAQVDCVDAGLPYAPAYGQTVGMNGFAAPSFAVQTDAPPRTVVQERVVYRDRPVARPAYRTTTRSTRTASTARDSSYEYTRQGRSWKKSALIIGGSAAGGAGVGAILGGKGGAKKGAVLGGVGGLVYDLATRNKDNR